MDTAPRTRLPHRVNVLLTFAIVALFAVALAACGSDSKDSTKASTDGTSSSTASSTDDAAVVIKTADNGSLGTVLVDAAGKTVYTLTGDSGDAVACTGGCLAAWPPVLLAGGETTAKGADGVKDLSVTTVADGSQVTSNGLPLYTFSGDSAAGDANGEGIVSFGGTWHVVKVGGSATSQSTTSTTSDSGY